MAKLIIDAIKPVLREFITKIKTGAPAAIDALIAWLLGILPGTIDKLTAAFHTLYGDIVGRLLAWIPTTRGPLVSAINKLLDLINTKVINKL